MSKQVIARRREAVVNPHPDPITGETGSHPLATGIGAGLVGTIGMLVGSVTGPVGAIAGAAIGSILGGLVGKSAAEAAHPTIEDYDVQVIDLTDARARRISIRSTNAPRSIQPVPVRPATDAAPIDGTQIAQPSIIPAALRGQQSLAANEDRYWQQEYKNQPYYRSGLTYRDYQPAYRLGYESYSRYHGTGMRYEEVEPELQQQYEREGRSAGLSWELARAAVRDGWYRVERAFRGR